MVRKMRFRDAPPYHNPGFVYIIKAQNGLYKIGKTHDVPKRLRDLKDMSPVAIFLIHVIPTNSMMWAEAELHKKFRKYHDHGEWFNLNDRQINWLKRLNEFNAPMEKFL